MNRLLQKFLITLLSASVLAAALFAISQSYSLANAAEEAPGPSSIETSQALEEPTDQDGSSSLSIAEDSSIPPSDVEEPIPGTESIVVEPASPSAGAARQATAEDTAATGTNRPVYDETSLLQASLDCQDGDTITFTQSITITGTSHITDLVRITKNVVVNGAGHTLYAPGLGFHLGIAGSGMDSTTVILRDLTLDGQQNYGGIVVSNATLSMDEKTTIKNCTDSGIRAAEARIMGGTLQNNMAEPTGGGITADTPIEVIGTTFVGNVAAQGSYQQAKGGAIHASGGALIQNCTFTDNTATHFGGAVFLAGNAAVSGCTFTGNWTNDSSTGGGAIFLGQGTTNARITGCNFYENRAPYGGAINAYSSVQISGCLFSGNTGTYGGGLFLNGSYTVGTTTVESSQFTGNRTSYGGGVYVMRGAALSITGCTLSGNASYEGGTLYLFNTNNSAIKLSRCTISDSQATARGGSVVLRNNCSLQLEDSSILRSNAGTNGGAVFMEGTASLVATGTMFSGGTAQGNGGAIYLDGTTGAISLADATLTGNKAIHGGAIYLEPGAYSCLESDRAAFTANLATAGSYAYTDKQYEGTYTANIRATRSLSQPFSVDGPDGYNRAYNNFDIAYTTGDNPLEISEIRYDANGGTGGTQETVLQGFSYKVRTAAQADVSRTGYTFTGWNTQPAGNGTHYSAGSSLTPSGDLVLYAQWTEKEAGSSSSQPSSSSYPDVPPPASSSSSSRSSSSRTSSSSSASSENAPSSSGQLGNPTSGGTDGPHNPGTSQLEEPGIPPTPDDAQLGEGGIPIGGLNVKDKWSLLNLILALLCVLGALAQSVLWWVRRRPVPEDRDDSGIGEPPSDTRPPRHRRVFRLVSICLGALALLLFLLVENLAGSVVWINFFTPFFLVLFALHLVSALLSAQHKANKKHRRLE